MKSNINPIVHPRFTYYMGSSVGGTLGGIFWVRYGWIGIIVYITSALAITFTLAAAIHFINHAHATAPTKVQA